MAETVYLAPGDEIASIKEKLDRARGNPVVLIAPKTVKALRDPLVLKLVQRHATFLGKDIALVSSDRTTRYLALFHGVSAFSSLTSVRRWRPKGHSGRGASRPGMLQINPGQSLGMTGLTFSFLSLVAVILPLTLGYLFFPSANITLDAAAQDIQEFVPITATVDIKAVDFQTGSIPARIVEDHLEYTDQMEIAGKKAVPDATATGQVTFVNKVDAKITVPKGTLISTKANVRFRTVDEVPLAGTKGSSGRVAIIADQPGKIGNVDRQAIDQVLDITISNQVFVVNESPTQGGTDKEVGAVTAQDRTRLETQALAKAKNEVYLSLWNAKKSSESIYPQTLNVQVVDAQFDRRVGEETKTLSVKLVVKGTILAFEAKDVNEVVANAVAKKMPKGLKASSAGLKIKPLGAEKWNERSVSFHAQADARAVTALDEDRIRREVAGKSKDEVEKYLTSTLKLANKPEVRVDPGWADSLPRFDWRIKVNVRTP